MLVQGFLEDSARRAPDKTALVAGSARLTYGELDAGANRMAHAFRALGLARGDRVAIFLDNVVEAVIALWATLKADGVFMMVNPTTKADKVAYMLNDARTTLMVTDAKKLEATAEIHGDTPSVKALVVVGETTAAPRGPRLARWDELMATHDADVSPPPARNIDIDLAALIYTSGSTGRPKGVMSTHLNIASASKSIMTYLEKTSEEVVLNVLPLAFDYGLYQLLMTHRAGGTLVLERSFTYPAAALQTMAREGVTGFPLVPTVLAILLQLDLTRFALPKLRYVSNTGQALPVEHIKKLRAAWPHVKIYSMYGLTECKRVSYLPPDQIDLRPDSIGRGMPNEEVYLVDNDGNRLPPGSTGELVVRGANVMKGYWELPEETERTYRPGPLPYERVLYTGDVFRQDAEGWLYFVGRKDDIIKSRGEKVSPREVENVLHAIPGIAEAAVVGAPDPVLGQAIRAVVVRSAGSTISEAEVKRECAARLEDFMVPKLVEFRDALPKGATGKIDKKAL